MDLLLRNIEPATVKKIDELAKQKGISRQEYLKRHLESFAVSGLHSDIIDRYEKQLQVNNMLLEKNTATMNKLIDTFLELMSDE